jgi:hypothetical protein
MPCDDGAIRLNQDGVQESELDHTRRDLPDLGVGMSPGVVGIFFQFFDRPLSDLAYDQRQL